MVSAAYVHNYRFPLFKTFLQQEKITFLQKLMSIDKISITILNDSELNQIQFFFTLDQKSFHLTLDLDSKFLSTQEKRHE